MDRSVPHRPARHLCTLAAVLAGSLCAQTPPASSPDAAPDLQSTTLSFAAEDKPILLSKVPGQIRVFVLEDIQRSGARSLGEFLAGEMPAEYAQQGGPGLPTQAFQGGARPQDTLVTLDGVRINDPGQTGTDLTQIPIVGIARIEVITGPQSARLGSGAQGGLIALFSGGAPDAAGSSGELAGRGGSNGQGGGRAMPGFKWGQGFLRAGNASGQQAQSTDTAQPFRYSSSFINLGQRFGGFGISLDYRNTYQGIPDPYETATVLSRVYDPARQDSQRVATSRLGLSWSLGPFSSLDVSLSHAQFSHAAPVAGDSAPIQSDGRSTGLTAAFRVGLGPAGLGLTLEGSQDRITQPGVIAGQDEGKARHAAFGTEFSIGLGPAARFVLNTRNGFDDQDLALAKGGTQFHQDSNGTFRGAFQVDLGFGFRAYAGGGRGYNAPLLDQALLNANNGGPVLRNESNTFSQLGVLFGKGAFYSRVEGTRSVVQNVLVFNGATFSNTGAIRVQGVQTTLGFKIAGRWGMEGFVRAQEARDLSVPTDQQYQTLPVAGRPFSTHGLKAFAGGGIWHLDLHYSFVGHRYEWVGDYTCNGTVPNVVDTDVVYRDLSAVGSLNLGKHVTLYFRGDHLLQPKIDIQQWLAKTPDGQNDAARVYGLPAPAATTSLEVVYRY